MAENQLQLIKDCKNDIDLSKCILCQKEKRNEKLTSTDSGRGKILISAEKLNDDTFKFFNSLNEDEKLLIKYHSKTCYKTYILKAERHRNESVSESTQILTEFSQPIAKRRRSDVTNDCNLCVICQKQYYKKDKQLYRLCESDRAEMFLLAIRFNLDDVYTRTSIHDSKEKLFAADILSHKHCMNRYLLQYQRDKIENEIENIGTDDYVRRAFETLLETIDLNTSGYTLSYCRDFINKKLENYSINNRHVKHLLIEHFGENICFSYSKDRSKPQMFFSSDIRTADVVETLRQKDSSNEVRNCAKILRDSCKEYNFDMQNSYCDSTDVAIAESKLYNELPTSWKQFFQTFFQQNDLSPASWRKASMIFQICFYTLKNGRQKTPMHVSIAQSIHDECRSKKLITVFNRLGLCISYDELERIDFSLALRIIESIQENNVPISSELKSEIIVHGAMDNFDRIENSSSGKSSTHDTILMIFQNNSESLAKEKEISVKNNHQTKRTIKDILPCQQKLYFNKVGRGKIPQDFKCGNFSADCSYFKANSDYLLWNIIRKKHVYNTVSTCEVPSYIAMKSMLQCDKIVKSIAAFTPILPFPATEFDTIFTCMKNFQDILIQNKNPYGPLWCDEGVYRIAKEIQLLRPIEFSNIFLGIGGFHTEKVVLGAIGKYLKDAGVENIFVETEVFGTNAVKAVLDGSHYVRSKLGINLLAEALSQMRLESYYLSLKEEEVNLTLQHFDECFKDMGSCLDNLDKDVINSKWNECTDKLQRFEESYNHFIRKQCEKSPLFLYWSIFLDKIFPIIRNLTHSFRERNWKLHLSSIRAAIPLLFAFDRINYSRWLPIYFEDCLSLPEKYPIMQREFERGNFTVQHTERQCSAVPIDQALEKAYNKTAKGKGGIIGVTAQKEAVAKWNLIKHEKMHYIHFLEHVADMNNESEYSLHHEYSKEISRCDKENVSNMINFIASHTNPFTIHPNSNSLQNIVTGTILNDKVTEYLLSCLDFGEWSYERFKSERLQEKSKGLFDKLKKCSKIPNQSVEIKQVDIRQETIKALKYIDYARVRHCDVSNLMKYELTETSLYLTKDFFLRKPQKSELVRLLEDKLSDSDENRSASTQKSCIIIDFMSFARRISLKNIKTFGEFAKSLWQWFNQLSNECSRTDIVFDLYIDSSIKSCERNRRKKSESISVEISSENQQLPTNIDSFWSSSENKQQFQCFFINWLKENYERDHVTYLGGSIPGDLTSCMRLTRDDYRMYSPLKCSHEEADDRLMYHITHAVTVDNFQNIVIAATDTDIFISALHHFHQWMYDDLLELWMLCGQGQSSRKVPLHRLANNMESTTINILPAAHALTGCDTTSKLGTKKSLMKVIDQYSHLITSFGKQPLCESMVNDAEKFLIRCFDANAECLTFDELRLRQYHKKLFSFDLEKLPPTSMSIKNHILRSYYQAHIWYESAFSKDILIEPLMYGYCLDENGILFPDIMVPPIPDDFPLPCSCQKCAKQNVCQCRVNSIPCCVYCKCSKEQCKNNIIYETS